MSENCYTADRRNLQQENEQRILAGGLQSGFMASFKGAQYKIMINGIVIIHKEAGYTSHDVVAKMRGICGQKKIGHTGTLDPEAVGVLPVCLGSATKLCDMLTDREKEYVAELLLGVETDTQDTTGQILAEHSVTVSEEDVRRVCAGFIGEYAQIPPMYSALKVNGKKLYELARAGKEVERKARPVAIRELEIIECRLPVVVFRVVCSKGTYVRTLCADIGDKLGCGGTMQRLTRTRAGGFRLEDAVTLAQLQQKKEEGKLSETVLPVDSVFTDCPALHVCEKYLKLLENGNFIAVEQTEERMVYPAGEWVRVYGKGAFHGRNEFREGSVFREPEEEFAGIYTYDTERGCYKPVKMFLPFASPV